MKRILLILGLFILILLWNCRKEREEPFLHLQQREYAVSNDTGRISLNIVSNGAWLLSWEEGWCRPEVRRGRGDARVDVIVAANPKGDSRVARMNLTGQGFDYEIVITQSALSLEIDSLSIHCGPSGGEYEIHVFSNTDWKAEHRTDWLTIDPAEGRDSGSFRITVAPCTERKDREGVVTVTAGNLEKKLTLRQEGILFEADTLALFFGLEGGTQRLAVRANVAWEAEGNDPWCRVEKVKDSLQVEVPATEEPRTTSVTIRSGDWEETVTVYQGRWHRDGEMVLFRPEDEGNPVKLVFMGDGFTEDDLAFGGAYDQAMAEAIDAYLSVEPYRTYRRYFCPYIVYALSEERGMSTRGSNNQIKVKKNTAFSVDVKEGTTLMNADLEKVLEYARKVEGLDTRNTSIVVAVNDARYAGTCYHWGNGQTVSLIPMNRDPNPPGGFDHLVVHEGAGHGFGRLADEYTGNGSITVQAIRDLTQSHEQRLDPHGLGEFLNVTALRDPETVYWGDFIGRPGYETVGFFEGAHNFSFGVWRCEERNCMIDNILYFSVACRLSIVKRLKAIAGETFDVDEFIENDVLKAPTPGQLAGTRSYVSSYYYPAPTSPIFVAEE